MKVTCLQENLQRALAQASRAVATKTALPVLSNVLLVAEDGQLRIAATDLHIGITTRIPAAIEEEGRITVDARLLAEFVNTLPNEQVELATSPSRSMLNITCGRTSAAINGIDAEDFPVMPTLSADALVIEIDPAYFREMVSQVELAAATDDSRPVLAGVLTRVEGSKVTLAAADGFRLAVREGELPAPGPERLEAIVPARAFRELSRIVGDSHEPVKLSITPTQSQLVAQVGQTDFLSSLIEGNFPDFRQIVPREFRVKVEVDREQLAAAVRRASYFARDNNDVIRLAFKGGEEEFDLGTLEVTANAAERGNSQSIIDAAVSGEGFQVAFNARYLSDVLGVLRQPKVVLGLNGPNQAGVVKPAGDDNYSHVIMPMVIGAN
ncbi:MAG: DNA polymerase III subunit beta [Thermomicrobiales bacterium]